VTVFEILRNLCRFAGGNGATGVTVGHPPECLAKQEYYRRTTEAAHGKDKLIRTYIAGVTRQSELAVLWLAMWWALLVLHNGTHVTLHRPSST
jgi:hypothetical protein